MDLSDIIRVGDNVYFTKESKCKVVPVYNSVPRAGEITKPDLGRVVDRIIRIERDNNTIWERK